MPRFEGVHQRFNAQKPYWLGRPKSEAQRKHFARMAQAVKARTPGTQGLGFIPVNRTGPPPPQFIEDIRRERIEQERKERVLALARATQEMFYAYLECHMHTSEWGDPEGWNVDHKGPCDCPSSSLRVRQVDMVDLLYRTKADVTFCGCQENDNTRLIYLGYIGGSPKYPETAFSIRVLRFFHITWKHCTSRVDPWTRGLDEFLDAFNPLILTKNELPRRWHTPFRWAIDAYRKMLSATENALDMELRLNPQDKLAENCPRCFGPRVPSAMDHEPDLIVCLDGNFQHRRHILAGQKAAKDPIDMPESFLPQGQVTAMENKLAGIAEEDVDPCAEQHIAANDRRGKGHWGGCDETGLMVMVCRHDHPLRFANIIQSGEKYAAMYLLSLSIVNSLIWFYINTSRLHYSYALIEWFLGMTEDQRVGFLYDIGCTMEKGIEKRNMFIEERNLGRLRFGTSVFHAYVHRWSCQLQWNPRLNRGWGLSDGEGSERVWSDLDPLVSSERYSTSQHRVDSIHMRSTHHRTNLCETAVVHITRKQADAIKRLDEADRTLQNIARGDPNLGADYFEDKWNTQRNRQLDDLTETQKHKRESLLVLLGLEEELVVALDRLKGIQNKRRRVRTEADNRELMALPGTVARIEEQIEGMANELGGAEFRELAGATRNQTNALLAISLAQGKLYETRVGLTEARLRRHRHTGWSHT
ncbi:hypothetical protein DFH28DRAFT_1077705 [Melampsora americana]|nr:hypothetical protein DFH28DRAFT_1077705 [Melampsora americana]